LKPKLIPKLKISDCKKPRMQYDGFFQLSGRERERERERGRERE
jgi:hypothetical protein